MLNEQPNSDSLVGKGLDEARRAPKTADVQMLAAEVHCWKKLAVIAGGALSLTLVLGISMVSVQSVRARAAEMVSNQEVERTAAARCRSGR